MATSTASIKSRSHLFIPDTQVKPGVPTAHLSWIGEYIVERKPDVVVHIGDHWDMPSLSSYEGRGTRKMEGKRYKQDIEAGNAAFRLLTNAARRVKFHAEWNVFIGNHEDRITRAVNEDPRLEGTIGLHDLDTKGWKVHDYLKPVFIDGICYSHYFYNPMSGNAFSGTVDNRLKQIGHSFSMGHQQTLLYGVRFVAGRSQHGLVAGSCYLHDESYKGPQGNAHWRGVIVKHEVKDGSYDPMFVSLDYLCRRFEGCSLERYKKLNKIK